MFMKLSKGLWATLVKLIQLASVTIGKIPQIAALLLYVFLANLSSKHCLCTWLCKGKSRCLSLSFILVKLIQFWQLVQQLYLFFKFLCSSVIGNRQQQIKAQHPQFVNRNGKNTHDIRTEGASQVFSLKSFHQTCYKRDEQKVLKEQNKSRHHTSLLFSLLLCFRIPEEKAMHTYQSITYFRC